MIKATIAAVAFTVCCLGNPADASTKIRAGNDSDNLNNSGVLVDGSNSGRIITNSNNRTRNVQQTFDYSEITNEATEHAPIPQPVGPAAPDSVAVLTIYGQVDQAGPVAGASISIPLN
ncbi:gp10 [Synechococcus phage Syn5]|uniref:Gp10 n=1 Tax=Synechococcus phage Syn5 TaxID=2914003 RepID=A4ZR91_9CAUD|nr:gp10 [Synechococcus phage Syn5]ABP87917.1 gp10 [Synechococcus phage Syn5]